MLILACAGLFLLWRLNPQRPALTVFLMGAALIVVGLCAAVVAPIQGFGKIRLLSWTAFLHLPLFLAGATLLFFGQERRVAYACAIVVLILLLVGADAFLIEPHWLEVTRITVHTEKLDIPIRVAVIADLQTDAPGQYEQQVLERAAAEEPDLILFAGDYLHINQRAQYLSAQKELNAILRKAGLSAPLGIYAVKGNVDWNDWPELFAGLSVSVFETTESLEAGPVVVTGLTLEDSSSTVLSVSAQAKYHIVLGHSPNFSLGKVAGDLLVAGHTHGGQVQLPLIGPLFTLSQVPRSWAAGVTTIAPGKVLVISRGVGMERGSAPRLRFLCRPQLVILDLQPVGAGK